MRATLETFEGSGKLNVWVEPLEWDAGEEGKERPLQQLEVRTWSYLDGTLAKPWEAFRETDAKCT